MFNIIIGLLAAIWRCICSIFSFFVSSKAVVKFNNGVHVSLEGCIGEGAFSFVYKGHSSETGLNYAIKKVIVQSSAIANDVKSEVKSLQRFVHPNIVELLDCVYVDDNKGCSIAYLLFPFAENGTLRTVLTAQLDGFAPKQYIGRVLTDFLAILEALQCLHDYTGDSYVHFDLKPENVLIFGDGKPVLTDFGSVRVAKVHIDSRQKSLKIADEASEHCTMPYRSPELFDPHMGSSLDSRTDIWSVGCLLFAWWYGYSPFECEFGTNSSSSGGSDFGSLEMREYEKNSDDGAAAGASVYRQFTQQHYPMKVVPCSHLRILAAPPARPTKDKLRDQSSDIIDNLVGSMIISEISNRPFLREVVHSVQGYISEVNGSMAAGSCDV
mgnify:FL=1